MEADHDPTRSNGEDAASTKIAELHRDLQDERDMSDFAKLAATQEIEKYRRECFCLRETVARLTDDYTTVRERGLRDRETIKGLMEEVEGKEREFAAKYVELKTEIRDLDRGRQRARDEVEEWKAKCSQLEARLSRLARETALDFERKGTELKLKFALLSEQSAKGKLDIAEEKFHLAEKDRATVKEEAFAESSQRHAGEVDDELPERENKSSWEDLVVVDSESDDEAICLSKKRLRDASETHSRECSVSTGANITSVEVTDLQAPLRAAKDSVERNRSPGSKKKFRRSNLICSSTARSRGSTGRESVSNQGAQAYHKRNFNNRTSERAYVGRAPSSEQHKQAKKRAEELRSKLKPCNPSFVKPMVQSHVSGSFYLSLPRKFCTEKLPACGLIMILEDENGVENGVKYISGDKPALSGGWVRFALDHNLELGDALIFELIEPTRFKVYIIKAIPEESCEDSDNMNVKEKIHGTDW